MNQENKKIVLITDSLFIDKENEKQIIEAGFEIERINNPKLSEEELCKEVKGKVGYILGGIENVTKKVIESANELKAISFTGSGYTELISGHEKATEKGILISNSVGGNKEAVAEFALTLIMMMNRKVLSLGRTGEKNFQTTGSLKNKKIGIICMGNIGSELCYNLKKLDVKEIYYSSRGEKKEVSEKTNAIFKSKDYIMENCDIVSIHCPKSVGDSFISKDNLESMKQGAILINTVSPEIIDLQAMYKLLKEERIYVAFDEKPSGDMPDFKTDRFFYSNNSTAYNTKEAIKKVSDMTTQSLINLLKKEDDSFCVNKN